MSLTNSRPSTTRLWSKTFVRRPEEETSSTTAAVTSSSSSAPSYIHAVFDKMMEERNKNNISSYSSPTSVVTVALTPPNNNSSNHVHSRIILDTLSEQQGTEVTLLEDTQLIPRRCFADDVEDEDDEEEEEDSNSIMTPLPTSPPLKTTSSIPRSAPSDVLTSPETPLKVPLCGVGRECWKRSEALSPSQRGSNSMQMQEYILALLSNKYTADTWHGQFSFFRKESNEAEEEQLKLQRNLLKRRPSQMKAQRRHLDDLRRDLQPFAASPKRTNLFRCTSHQRVQSARKAKNTRNPLKDLPSNKAPAKTSLWTAFACHQAVPENVLDDTYNYETSGYDSDPECFGRTPSVRSPTKKEEPTARRLFALDVMGDDEGLEEEAKSILNEKWTLILHEPNKRPQAFHVWIERGQRLLKTLVTPKLSWKPLPKKGDRNCIKSVPALSIDILDIQRILPLDEIDRKQYPLAKAGDSFLLKTVDGCFCWQASSIQERDRLIALWKLTVARFGSMIITGDDDGMEEYFAPVDAGVLFAQSN